MSQAPKDTRSAAEKARDTAGIIGSFKHEGYVPTPETEAIHQRAERGEITTEEVIAIFRERALELERIALARKRQQPGYDYWRASSRLGCRVRRLPTEVITDHVRNCD